MLVNEAKNYIKQIFVKSSDLAVMLWGPPGIGKTSICRETAEELGFDYLCLQVSVYNPIDLAGLPCPDKDSGIARYLPPSFLEPALKATRPMILVFDEIASAPPAVQVATQRVILERKFGEFSLSKHVRIVATGNRASDRANTFMMPAPLANRFLHVDVGYSVDDWKQWAINNGINDLIIAYLNFSPDSLYKFPEDPEVKAFPTPRSWEFVSKLLNVFEPKSENFMSAVATAIGEPAAAGFVAFVNTYTELPDVNAILDGKLKYDPPHDRIDLLYALCGSLVGNLKRNPTPNRVDNFLTYINNLPKEFTMLALRDAFMGGLNQPILKSPKFKEFSKINLQWVW